MNILIVESENDQYFIEAIVKEVEMEVSSETQVRNCRIDEYKYSTLDERSLITQITNAITDTSRNVSKIGIILDMDDSTQDKRIELINKCLIKSFADCGYPVINGLLTNINNFITCKIDDNLSIKIACFFTNVDSKGELETVLREIKLKKSIFADCLYEGWLKCIEDKGKKLGKKGEQCDISDKELLKLWVDFYKRFDTLKKSERNEENTDWRGIMTGITKPTLTKKEKQLNTIRGNDIFDLSSTKLDDIKSFLKMFD